MKTLLLAAILALVQPAKAALYFMADNGQVAVTAANTFGATSNLAFTVSMWLKVIGSQQNGQANLFSRAAGQGWQWQIHDLDYFQLYCYGSPATYRNSSSGTITRNVWQHVLMTWDGRSVATSIRFFVNGVEATYGTTNNGGLPNTQSGSLAFAFGNNLSGGAGCLNGHMAEVAVWTNVLTQVEINTLNTRIVGMPLQVRKVHLVGYWPLIPGPDGGTNTAILTDRSGRNDHAVTTYGISFAGPRWVGSPFSYP